jgi:endonuclease YncB( thermonuclease family)
LAALIATFSAFGIRAEPINVDTIAVVDGDTIDVGPQRYRLVGFDTPEISTPRRKASADRSFRPLLIEKLDPSHQGNFLHEQQR